MRIAVIALKSNLVVLVITLVKLFEVTRVFCNCYCIAFLMVGNISLRDFKHALENLGLDIRNIFVSNCFDNCPSKKPFCL